MTRSRITMFVVALLVILAIAAGDALACPMCKAALGSHDRSHGDLVGGFFWSILFMLSMPFLIFGSLSTYMYLLVRRARREANERRLAEQGVVQPVAPASAVSEGSAVASAR